MMPLISLYLQTGTAGSNDIILIDKYVSPGVYVTETLPVGTLLASPALTGVPTAPTASLGTNTTQLATTAFVLANGGTGDVLLGGDLGNTNAAPYVLSTHLTSPLPVAQGGTGAATLTGLLKGNGTSAFTPATAGTDYLTPTGSAAALTSFPTLNQSTTGNAATVTTNANLTGPVTSTGNATAIANGAITNAMLANGAVANLSGTNTGDQTLSGLGGLPLAGGTMTGTITSQTIAPSANNTYNLGSTSDYYQYVYGSRHYVNSTAYLDGGTAGQTTLTGNLLGDGSNNSTIQGYIIAAYGGDSKYHLTNTNDSSTDHGFWVCTYNANMVGYSLSSGEDYNNVLYIGNRFVSGHTVIGTAHQQTVNSVTDLTQILDDGLGNMTVKGSLTLGTAGSKINVTTGSNASAGTGTLVGGTATVATTAVTASSLIFVQDTSTSTTNVGVLTVSAKTAGTSFVVTSTLALDTSTFNWFIIN
jgi:hypothetical protein